MSKFTISIILILAMLIANAVYIINKDIETTKKNTKQRERILDFEMSPKFQIKSSSKKNINYINKYSETNLLAASERDIIMKHQYFTPQKAEN